MVWKCPPLNLFNWSNFWKWKETMSDGGKGDAPRPLGVTMEQFDKNFDSIFGKKKKEQQNEIVDNKQFNPISNTEPRSSDSCGR